VKQIDNRQKQQIAMRAQKASLGGKNPLTKLKEQKRDFAPSAHEPAKEAPAEKQRQEGMAGPVHRSQPKVGRNDPCPCGSGKKYKKCCLQGQ